MTTTHTIRGVSSDCTLPPAIVLGLMFSDEYPCDRCNEDRKICRGESRKKDGVAIDTIPQDLPDSEEPKEK